MKPYPYFLALFATVFLPQYVFAQLLPTVNKRFENVEIYKIQIDQKGKATKILVSSEQAISRFVVTSDESGDRTYLKFYCSLLNGESVMSVSSTKKEMVGNTIRYTANCSDIVHDENSIWFFYWQDGELVDVIQSLPEQNAMFKYK